MVRFVLLAVKGRGGEARKAPDDQVPGDLEGLCLLRRMFLPVRTPPEQTSDCDERVSEMEDAGSIE
jgi:hypothetical protein